jgi:predicted GNAT family acetyltransferase
MNQPDLNRIKLRELAQTDWSVIEQLFGSRGACGGCWCMSWRREKGGKLWEESKGEPNRKEFKRLVESGEALGVLAFDGDVPVAWCAFGKRTVFPRTERMKAYSRTDIDLVWSVNCFFIGRGYRGIGLAEKLLEKAVAGIKRRKGKIIEGYPVPLTKAGDKLPAAFAYTGPEIIFKRQGFKLIQKLSASRPLYRLTF